MRNELKQKYYINGTFLQQHRYTNVYQNSGYANSQIVTIQHQYKNQTLLKVNTKYTSVTKITCKDFYWHIIDKQKHTSTNIFKNVVHNIYRFE